MDTSPAYRPLAPQIAGLLQGFPAISAAIQGAKEPKWGHNLPTDGQWGSSRSSMAMRICLSQEIQKLRALGGIY